MYYSGNYFTHGTPLGAGASQVSKLELGNTWKEHRSRSYSLFVMLLCIAAEFNWRKYNNIK